ncbi:hypothetical protein ANTRET_LOCUS2242 [Anthophora retusa]
MKEAMLRVMDGKLTVRLAVDKYDIPHSTLQNRVKALKSGREVTFKLKLGKFESTFDENFSFQLYNHVRYLYNNLMSLTRSEFLKPAFDLVEYLKIPR